MKRELVVVPLIPLLFLLSASRQAFVRVPDNKRRPPNVIYLSLLVGIVEVSEVNSEKSQTRRMMD
jgi:hypothetical protein